MDVLKLNCDIMCVCLKLIFNHFLVLVLYMSCFILFTSPFYFSILFLIINFLCCGLFIYVLLGHILSWGSIEQQLALLTPPPPLYSCILPCGMPLSVFIRSLFMFFVKDIALRSLSLENLEDCCNLLIWIFMVNVPMSQCIIKLCVGSSVR